MSLWSSIIDGSLLMQYLQMPADTGSWSRESIGFEDQTGSRGVQIAYGEVPISGTAFDIPASCHVRGADASQEESACCTSQVCQCENIQCTIVTDYPFEWVDIIESGLGTRIDQWQQNADDGWYQITLPFHFNWFGNDETAITVGTNGVITFGDSAQLPYGSSEPCPCSYGDAACNTGEVEGVIAIFWCDLDPSITLSENSEGVYYYILDEADPRLVAWDKLVVEWRVPVWGQDPAHTFHFEAILTADGSVVFQYEDMPTESGSWSLESIGFEDQTGSRGAQILYGEIPPPNSAYRVPPSCHVSSGDVGATTCCSSQVCQCTSEVQCQIVTDYEFNWVDLIDSGAGIVPDRNITRTHNA